MMRWYLDFSDQILNGLCAQTGPSLTKFFEGAGHLPDWDILLMQTAYSLEPALLSPDLLIERIPYTRPASFIERMLAACQRGWLYEVNEGFCLTDAGREIVDGMYELGDRLHGKIKVLTRPQMEHLLTLSDRVIKKIKELPEPVGKPAFKLSLHFDRGPLTPPIVQIRQQILVILAFRDDAHVAAWRSYEPDGQLWETFTLIWQEQAGSAAELTEHLPHRNYTESDYARALEKLVADGWITYCGSRFIAQEQAVRMRQEVEVATDHIFNAAFASLCLAEMDEFQNMMRKLATTVTPQGNRTN